MSEESQHDGQNGMAPSFEEQERIFDEAQQVALAVYKNILFPWMIEVIQNPDAVCTLNITASDGEVTSFTKHLHKETKKDTE